MERKIRNVLMEPRIVKGTQDFRGAHHGPFMIQTHLILKNGDCSIPAGKTI